MKKNNLSSAEKKHHFPILESQAFSPELVTERGSTTGAHKIRLPFIATFALGILGGAVFIGALYYLIYLKKPWN